MRKSARTREIRAHKSGCSWLRMKMRKKRQNEENILWAMARKLEAGVLELPVWKLQERAFQYMMTKRSSRFYRTKIKVKITYRL